MKLCICYNAWIEWMPHLDTKCHSTPKTNECVYLKGEHIFLLLNYYFQLFVLFCHPNWYVYDNWMPSQSEFTTKLSFCVGIWLACLIIQSNRSYFFPLKWVTFTTKQLCSIKPSEFDEVISAERRWWKKLYKLWS